MIGIEEGWTKHVVDGIAATGKPVTGFGIELHGDHDTIMRASKAAREYVQWASERQREECAVKDLWVSTQVRRVGYDVGLRLESDRRQRVRQALCARAARWSSARRPSSPAASRSWPRAAARQGRAEFMRMFDRYQDVINRHKTSDLSESQPTKGNIAGGLTTIEEKALGNIQKIGTQVHGGRRARQGRDADAARACGSWTSRRPRPRW